MPRKVRSSLRGVLRMATRISTRKRQGRGRPGRALPPRVDAPPEEIARRMFALDGDWPSGEKQTFRCVKCARVVSYPETLAEDGRCEACKKEAEAPREKCFCGIEVEKANRICTERDCPWKR